MNNKNFNNPVFDWICLSGDDYWNSNPHSRYHIAKQLSKRSRVLWVNSIGSRFPTLKKKNGFRLIANKLKSYLIFFRKPEPGFYILSPVTIPLFKGSLVKKINENFLWYQIKLFIFLLGLKNPHFFISSPSFGILSTRIKNFFCIYYYSDLYISHREIKYKSDMEDLDKRLLGISSLVYCCSKKICEVVQKEYRNAKYLPHSVDREHFTKSFIKPEELKNIKSPIIGYYGTLSDSNDWEIIDYLSLQRPDYSFVFIGKKTMDIPLLEQRENIFFLDRISYDQIPAYGSFFDVAIMFWILRDWILHSSPLKLLEYFALGKPVVSVDIPEVRKKFGDVVFISKDKYCFLENVDRALKIDRKELEIKYDLILKENSWSKLTDQIYMDLERVQNVQHN